MNGRKHGKPSRSRAVERHETRELLLSMSPGQQLSYHDIMKSVGFDPQKERFILDSARRSVIEEGYVFEIISRFGLYRLTDAEIALKVPDYRSRRVQGQARRGLAELGAIQNFAKLTQNQQIESGIGRALFGAIVSVTTAKAAKLLRQVVADRIGQDLPVQATLNALRAMK